MDVELSKKHSLMTVKIEQKIRRQWCIQKIVAAEARSSSRFIKVHCCGLNGGEH